MWCIQNISECNPPPFSTSDFDKAYSNGQDRDSIDPLDAPGCDGLQIHEVHLMGKMWPISPVSKQMELSSINATVQSPPDDRGTLSPFFRCLVQCDVVPSN